MLVSESGNATNPHYSLPQYKSSESKLFVSGARALNDGNEPHSKTPWNAEQRGSGVHVSSQENTTPRDSTVGIKGEPVQLLGTAENNHTLSLCKQMTKNTTLEIINDEILEHSDSKLFDKNLSNSFSMSPVVKEETMNDFSTEWDEVELKDVVTTQSGKFECDSSPNDSKQMLVDDNEFGSKNINEDDSQAVIEHDQSESSNQKSELKFETSDFADLLTLDISSLAELHGMTSKNVADDGFNRAQMLVDNDQLFDPKCLTKDDLQAAVIEHDQSESSNAKSEFKSETSAFADLLTLDISSLAELHGMTSNNVADDGFNRVKMLVDNNELFDPKNINTDDLQAAVIEDDQSESSNQKSEFKSESSDSVDPSTLDTSSLAELHGTTSKNVADDGSDRVQVCPERFLCRLCGIEISRVGILDHFRSEHSREKKCLFCDRNYKGKARLERHLKIHTGIKPHKCNKCPAEFLFRDTLNKHMITHTDAKDFQCSQCDRKFRRKDILKSHEANQHTRTDREKKKYHCSRCDKKFNRKDHLKDHEKARHSNERPFKCNICLKTFKLVAYVRNHLATHIIRDKPYSCDHCDSKFASPALYRSHVKVHEAVREKFECERCGKQFLFKPSLRSHRCRQQPGEDNHTDTE